MNSTNYHTKKETEVKFLNKISQLVENNRFDGATKDKVKVSIEKAVNAIIANRKEVYKDLNDYDATELVHEPKDELMSNEKNKSANQTRYIAHDCVELAVSLKASNSMPVDVIMDEISLKKYFPTEEFKKNETVLIDSLREVVNAMTETQVEETVKEDEVKDEEKTPKKKKSIVDKILNRKTEENKTEEENK